VINFYKVLSISFFIIFPNVSMADILVIKPTSTIAKKSIKSQKNVVLQGKLETVPFVGAMWTIQSREFGQVLLFRPQDISEEIANKLEVLEARGNMVNVTGNLLLLCTMRELNSGMLGCRQFDNRKKIKVEILSP
jgi:hypothetical protein